MQASWRGSEATMSEKERVAKIAKKVGLGMPQTFEDAKEIDVDYFVSNFEKRASKK